MRTLLWLAPLVVLGGSSCSRPAPPPPSPPFQTVATGKELMNAVLDPAVDVIWDAVGWIVTSEGTFAKAPATDDEWATVRASAIQLAESGNLLMIGNRSGGSPEWITQSQALIDTSRRAIQAIDKKDKDALFTIGGDLYDVCTNCHRQFMPGARQ
ncbi:MAG: hypothetical protein Q7R30_05770 [Acidobacteriota bacterium]|nr:hypothetical protein [Acidobacteriota bacterium]